MIDEEYKEVPVQDKPKPRIKAGDTVKWLEDHLGFRPHGVEW